MPGMSHYVCWCRKLLLQGQLKLMEERYIIKIFDVQYLYKVKPKPNYTEISYEYDIRQFIDQHHFTAAVPSPDEQKEKLISFQFLLSLQIG
ncbi:CLUMA_CG013427, isoform A [Clunio marinus]|uniref:CLUMA_CG013427, isoform A n=1 Tax=Clunio marinus TaxID=568069 RepID=A0A1J1IIT1_9DIPT|nr:CLUMA_CG013427, isoform A [Clunio marinus]